MSQLPPPAEQPSPPVRPLALEYATPELRRVDLRAIAVRQRAVIGCILLYIILAVSGLVIPSSNEFLWMAEAVLAFAIVIAASVLAFILALSVYSDPATGVLGGMLIFIPLIGLLILLVINHDATKVLRRHGVRVGMLGARLRDIPPREQTCTS